MGSRLEENTAETVVWLRQQWPSSAGTSHGPVVGGGRRRVAVRAGREVGSGAERARDLTRVHDCLRMRAVG